MREISALRKARVISKGRAIKYGLYQAIRNIWETRSVSAYRFIRAIRVIKAIRANRATRPIRTISAIKAFSAI